MRFVVLSLTLAAGCGGASTVIEGAAVDGGLEADGGLGADGGLEASSDGGSHDDGAPGSACPSAIPANGAACTPQGLSCEYGGVGDHLLCSTIAVCQQNSGGAMVWFVSPPAAGCIASPADNPLGCPPSFTTIPTGASCPREPARQCVFAEGVCGCTPCASSTGTMTNEWLCESWPTPSGCPAARPRLGTACTQEGQSCMYPSVCEVNDGEPAMICQNGLWTFQAYGADCAILTCGQ
jgi:hypothetical protein